MAALKKFQRFQQQHSQCDGNVKPKPPQGPAWPGCDKQPAKLTSTNNRHAPDDHLNKLAAPLVVFLQPHSDQCDGKRQQQQQA
jgi:hypothetical protein